MAISFFAANVLELWAPSYEGITFRYPLTKEMVKLNNGFCLYMRGVNSELYVILFKDCEMY